MWWPWKGLPFHTLIIAWWVQSVEKVEPPKKRRKYRELLCFAFMIYIWGYWEWMDTFPNHYKQQPPMMIIALPSLSFSLCFSLTSLFLINSIRTKTNLLTAITWWENQENPPTYNSAPLTNSPYLKTKITFFSLCPRILGLWLVVTDLLFVVGHFGFWLSIMGNLSSTTAIWQ